MIVCNIPSFQILRNKGTSAAVTRIENHTYQTILVEKKFIELHLANNCFLYLQISCFEILQLINAFV